MPLRLFAPFVRWLRPAAPPPRPVHEPEDFRTLLRRECARADRTCREFSLVVLAPAEGSAREVVHLLGRRLRETDEIGWMESGAVGALLTDTARPGADLVAREVVDTLEAAGTPPAAHAVFTYPGDWIASPEAVPSLARAVEGGERDSAAAASVLEPLPPCLQPYPAWKRAMDVAGALVAIVVLSPVLLLVALAVRLSSPGPLLFRQERIGYRGRPFTMLKFRSMYVDASSESHERFLQALISGSQGSGFKLKGDPRVTRVGRVIRKWSLDELPQLFNVLKGDMSLVGPRPEPPYAQAGYARWYYRRVLGSKPGITGLWQVRGRSRVSYETMVRMDLRYSQRISPVTDARLLVETVRAVLSAEGAY
ncbi:MAG TPA: sugar transferase [Longimicrobium sp.]